MQHHGIMEAKESKIFWPKVSKFMEKKKETENRNQNFYPKSLIFLILL